MKWTVRSCVLRLQILLRLTETVAGRRALFPMFLGERSGADVMAYRARNVQLLASKYLVILKSSDRGVWIAGAKFAEEYLLKDNFAFDEMSYADACLEACGSRLVVNDYIDFLGFVELACLAHLYQVVVHRVLGIIDSSPVPLFLALEAVVDVQEVDFVRRISRIDELLDQDPARVYSRMDAPTKQYYRRNVLSIAQAAECSPLLVAQNAVTLAQEAARAQGHLSHTHIGFYLVDDGKLVLCARLGVPVTTLTASSTAVACLYAGSIFLVASGMALVAAIVFSLPHVMFAKILSATLFVLVASEIAHFVIDEIVKFKVRPRQAVALAKGTWARDDASVVLCVPSLLVDLKQTNALICRLERQYCSLNEPKARVVLLTDFPDAASAGATVAEEALLTHCMNEIDALNKRYAHEGRPEFVLLHRARQFCRTQQRWIGWERKRGKILQFGKLMVDGVSEFDVSTMGWMSLRDATHAFVIDDDTTVLPDTIPHMLGIALHPLNLPVLDECGTRVVRGHGIIVPGSWIRDEAVRTWRLRDYFAGLHGDENRFPYPPGSRSISYDLFGERQFSGKGLYWISVFDRLLRDRLPLECVLSHDTLEGAWLRPCYAREAVVTEGFPPTYATLSERAHRWTRGDWQNAWLWLTGRLRFSSSSAHAAPSAFAGFYLADLLRHGLAHIALAGLFVIALGSNESDIGRRVAVIGTLMLLPTHLSFLSDCAWRSIMGFGSWGGLLRGLGRAYLAMVVHLALVPHRALMTLDAVARTVWRIHSGSNRLEWTASSDTRALARKHLVRWVFVTISICCAAFAALLWSNGMGTVLVWALLGAWGMSPLVARSLTGSSNE